MDEGRFERLVEEALESLPEEFLVHLENVEVSIEHLPTAEDLADAGLEGEPPQSLLGLYFGVPLTDRYLDFVALPDRIILYQGSIEAAAGKDPEAVREQVRVTVVHEIAHFYGFSEDQLDDMGWG